MIGEWDVEESELPYCDRYLGGELRKVVKAVSRVATEMLDTHYE